MGCLSFNMATAQTTTQIIVKLQMCSFISSLSSLVFFSVHFLNMLVAGAQVQCF